MAKVTVWRFIVSGVTPFPLDMLRYDACYPVEQDSVAEIESSRDSQDRAARRLENWNKQYRVMLCSHVNSPTDARWSSFGWRVLDVKKETR
jgi:hypothetical protein